MFRRIDVIYPAEPATPRFSGLPERKAGWCGEVVIFDGLRAPKIKNRRVRFFYTENGWKRFGRPSLAQAIAEYGVARVHIEIMPMHNFDIVYRDQYQVAGLRRLRKGE